MYKRIFSVFIFIVILVFPGVKYAESNHRDSWGGSSALNSKINDLDNDKVVDLPVPVLFGVTPENLSRNFGDPRFGGRIHEGLDIMAPKGAPIVTPTEVVVLRTGDGDSSGKYVYTANPGGETFAYMHLDEIANIEEGDELKKGDLIGYVGNTGNASLGADHLHFEIRNDDGASDPFPRLTRIFPLAEKIKYLEEILDNVSDQERLAKFIVANYIKELLLAKTLNITLPLEIEKLLPTLATPTTPQINTTSSPNLTLGSRGIAVVALQNFLISKNIGSASRVVADGSFGPITQRALADYQLAVGIMPALGYYGPVTRAYIAVHP